MKTEAIISLIGLCAAMAANASGQPVNAEITAPPSVRQTMAPPTGFSNQPPQKVLAPKRIAPHPPEQGTMNAQPVVRGDKETKMAPSVNVGETNALQRSVEVDRAARNPDSRPKIRTDPLVLRGASLPEAIKSAQKRGSEK
jgi:hypothetical protein